MDDFNYRGKRVQFWKLQGEVLDSDRYSETRVTARSGVGNARVRMRQKTYHDFWIRGGDGREQSIQLEDVKVPLRAGQQVTVVCAGLPRSERGWLCSLVNHSTGRSHDIIPAKTLQRRLRLERITGVSLIFALAVAALVVYLTLPPSGYFAHPWRMARWDYAAIAGVVVLVLGAWRKSRRGGRAARALKAHIGEAVSQAQQGHA